MVKMSHNESQKQKIVTPSHKESENSPTESQQVTTRRNETSQTN